MILACDAQTLDVVGVYRTTEGSSPVDGPTGHEGPGVGIWQATD